jgi:hypothetical protein
MQGRCADSLSGHFQQVKKARAARTAYCPKWTIAKEFFSWHCFLRPMTALAVAGNHGAMIP